MGDSPAELVQRLYLAESARLRGFALGLTGDRALAEDAVQETFLVCVAKAADYTPGTNFTAWSRAILRFKVLEQVRRRDHRHLPLTEAALASLSAEAPTASHWDQHRRALAACLQHLAPKARKLTELRHLDQLSPVVIAKRLGWTVNAVHVGLSRARNALRLCIEERLEQSDG